MESIKKKVTALQALNWRAIACGALALLIVGLVLWGCISTSNAKDMQRKYASSRQAVADTLYGVTAKMTLEYDNAYLAGADVEGDILPSMRTYFAQARALNSAMSLAYGEKYTVLDDGLLKEIDAAFAEYDSAFRGGRSTDVAGSMMTEAMAHTRRALDAHYGDDASLK